MWPCPVGALLYWPRHMVSVSRNVKLRCGFPLPSPWPPWLQAGGWGGGWAGGGVERESCRRKQKGSVWQIGQDKTRRGKQEQSGITCRRVAVDTCIIQLSARQAACWSEVGMVIWRTVFPCLSLFIPFLLWLYRAFSVLKKKKRGRMAKSDKVSQYSVHKSQLLKRKESQSGIELSSFRCCFVLFFSSNCFTSTETIRLIRDGEPRTATTIFTQLLSSVSYILLMSSDAKKHNRDKQLCLVNMVLNVHSK